MFDAELATLSRLLAHHCNNHISGAQYIEVYYLALTFIVYMQVIATTPAVVDSTIEVYNSIREQLLPTPSKPHYTFNLRDVARVIQGVMRADPKTTTEPKHLTVLWLHESHRVFADRLVNADDAQRFR